MQNTDQKFILAKKSNNVLNSDKFGQVLGTKDNKIECFGENIIYADNDKEYGRGIINISRESRDPCNPGVDITIGLVSERDIKIPITVSDDKTTMSLRIDNLTQYATLKTFVRDLYAFLYKEPELFCKSIKDGDIEVIEEKDNDISGS